MGLLDWIKGVLQKGHHDARTKSESNGIETFEGLHLEDPIAASLACPKFCRNIKVQHF